jgi:dihydroorotase
VPFGIVGLETLLPICVQTLIEPGHLDWPGLIEKLTAGPARILGIDKGSLAAETDADVTLIDPAAEWTIDPKAFRSKGRNTPFGGRTVRGRIHTVLVNGEVRYRQ